jgi:hypothetical protein
MHLLWAAIGVLPGIVPAMGTKLLRIPRSYL